MISKPYALANPVLTKRSIFWSQYFYFFMSLLVAAVIVYGFSHTIDKNLIHPKIPRRRLLYFHAALFIFNCVMSNLAIVTAVATPTSGISAPIPAPNHPIVR